MENIDAQKPDHPLLLRILMVIGMMFLGALGLLLLSLILGMLGYAYGIGNMSALTIALEQVGVGLLGLSILLGGGISIMGMTMRSLAPSTETTRVHEKQKHDDRLYDIREHGLTVEEVLDDMSMQERELLAEKLAESRLAIREDGTLIPLEQAEKLYKIERFIDG